MSYRVLKLLDDCAIIQFYPLWGLSGTVLEANKIVSGSTNGI
jgi:hypothetical protein